jgi:hypothetical protein
VDLRLLNLAPQTFRHEVMARAVRLWTRNLVTVADLELRTWRTYWHLQPRFQQHWEKYR